VSPSLESSLAVGDVWEHGTEERRSQGHVVRVWYGCMGRETKLDEELVSAKMS
jgi:hypothetical protein